MYKITLNDGTTLENLELNGNNFIAAEVVNDAVFKETICHYFKFTEINVAFFTFQ